MCPSDGTHLHLPECVVPLTMFMRGPLLSEAAVVDLEALQSLHLACGPSCTQVPYWDKLQAGCRPGALPSVSSFGSPGDCAMHHGQSLLCQLTPSKVCPLLLLCSCGLGPFPAGLAPGWWLQVCQKAEPGKETQIPGNGVRNGSSESPTAWDEWMESLQAEGNHSSLSAGKSLPVLLVGEAIKILSRNL